MRKKHIELVFMNLLLVVAGWIVVFYYYPLLPEKVPMHFGFHGPPDAWGSKNTIFTSPGVQTGLFLLLLLFSFFIARYPETCNFPVDLLKRLSSEEKEELYGMPITLLLTTDIFVNSLFIYITATVINVALGKWNGINGYIMAFLICSMFGFVAYYAIKMRRMKREKHYHA